MCGHYGDPAAAPDCIDIFKYFQEHNPACNLGIISNGSLRNEAWWAELAKVLTNGQQHYADFSIDGLADTNHIYRKNTDFDKIIRNASAFIKAGGNANWVMLVFKHNQHQVEEARKLSQELGFTNFTKKVSRRFGMFGLDKIEPPDDYTEIYKEFPVAFTKPSKITMHRPTTIFNNPIDIQCRAIKEKSLAVTADGQIIPCGFIYRGPNQDPRLTRLLGSKNFQSLVDTWTTRTPYYACENTCNTLNNDPANMKFFNRQWDT
jgi:sulfatase maturation enzyme AslB (radical SAM superfamily)